MEKLSGHGRPSPKFEGEVGQHYEDLDTGDIYECRISSQYSPTHGWPVGGYVWELRAKGEDIKEIYGSGGSGGANVCYLFYDNDKYIATASEGAFRTIYDNMFAKRNGVIIKAFMINSDGYITEFLVENISYESATGIEGDRIAVGCNQGMSFYLYENGEIGYYYD